MRLERSQAKRLAAELRRLRESAETELTQGKLATALSADGKVAAATLSSWESASEPKTPPNARLRSYAHFFCTPRSLEGDPHLIPDDELTPDEQVRRQELEDRLLELANPVEREVHRSFQFESGSVVVICPTLPDDLQGALAAEKDPNFTKLRQYGDLDALIEIYGHLRAENPKLDVFHRLTHDVKSDDFTSHVILLGGIGWNPATLFFQEATSQVPITQVAVDDLKDGDIFVVETPEGVKKFYPQFRDRSTGKELIGDVGCIIRLRNPFKTDCTLTICNGIFSRGVYGAVRCLTDAKVRDKNEEYLAKRFPGRQFAMLVRVPVVTNENVSPDLQNPALRLFEWSPPDEGNQG